MREPIRDERVIIESNRIYRLCFCILCSGMLIDLLIKFNMYTFDETASQTLQLFLLESVLLVTVFYFALFALARKGIAFGYSSVELGAFPKKRYSAISASVAAVLTVGLWAPRLIAFDAWSTQMANEIFVIILIILLTFILACSVMLLSFYAAFRVARRTSKA